MMHGGGPGGVARSLDSQEAGPRGRGRQAQEPEKNYRNSSLELARGQTRATSPGIHVQAQVQGYIRPGMVVVAVVVSGCVRREMVWQHGPICGFFGSKWEEEVSSVGLGTDGCS